MAVDIERLASKAGRPARPRTGVWLASLVVCVAASTAVMLLFAPPALPMQASRSWAVAVGAPVLAWCLLGFVRALVYVGQHHAADAWDAAREADLALLLCRGRRSQQVLAVSLQTALRAPGAEQSAHCEALLEGSVALKAQPFDIEGDAVRHSRLAGALDEPVEAVLLRAMKQLIEDLEPALSQVPATAALALLLTTDEGAMGLLQRDAWQSAWRESGFCQAITPFEGVGLAALDDWLDRRITDQAMLLVVAMQFAPPVLQGTAQVAVGLLLGNRRTQTRLAPIAYLHRPVQAQGAPPLPLRNTVLRALDWATLRPSAVMGVWRAGVSADHDAGLASALAELMLPARQGEDFLDMDASLGHAGAGSAWLAIAAAALAVQRGAGPQLIFSGDRSAHTDLWCTALCPVSSTST